MQFSGKYAFSIGQSTSIFKGCHANPFQHLPGLVRGHVGDVEDVVGLKDVALTSGKIIRTKQPVGKDHGACNKIICRANQEKSRFSLLQIYVVFLEKDKRLLILKSKFQ